ncbi:MAG TPA: MHYT domain-containing protein [Azospirillaceae bacterium]|nr:MHYT domain-containing protein [Azospirillaceae bacterium]
MTAQHIYDPALVTLSVVVAAFASFTALDLASRARASPRARLLWLGCAALAMGGGVWCMHFVGMLALVMPMPVAYDVPLTLLSLALPVLVTGAGLVAAEGYRVRPVALPLAGVLMGLGIVTMHYMGMAAMRMGGSIAYDSLLVAASVAIAVAAATAALWLAFRTDALWERVTGALLMGVAVSGMHYTGMAAAAFRMDHGAAAPVDGIAPVGLAVTVAAVTLLVLLFALAASARDRANAVRAEREAEQLAVSERRFRSITANSGDVIAVTDADGVFRFVGASTRALLGRDPDWLLGRPLPELLAPSDAEEGRRLLRLAQELARPVVGQLVVPHADGSPRDMELTVVDRTRDADVGGLVVTLRDLTERKRLQESLARASRLATLGTLAAGVAHEMSQPLNVIRLWSGEGKAMLDDDPLEPERLREVFDLIGEQTRRMREIIDHMQLFARADAAAAAGPFDAAGAVASAIALVERQFAPQGVVIDWRPPPAPLYVSGRPVQLEQVAVNLLTNARDAILAARGRGEREAGTIVLEMSAGEGSTAVLTARDDGGGIPPEFLDRLFDPFFTTKEVGSGTGLGLSITHGIVESMGGRIEVSNATAPGGRRGACFTIRLPAVRAAETAESRA